jgi:hypothetical protein
VATKRQPLTKEQQWMADNWPGYHNGVSFSGLFVIEDWMFWRSSGKHEPKTLHLNQQETYDNHMWSQDLLATGDLEAAYATYDCHYRSFVGDKELDELAEFGINSVRMAVGYWFFDDPTLYEADSWVHEWSDYQGKPYGVNPDGFITPGTLALTDMVVKLWNRNINVVLDMHALPGCSSPRNTYAGIHCEDSAPNYWNGQAHDGISGGHPVNRVDDGKTWSDVGRKIALERVVPWIAFVNSLAPGAVVAYELVNEPDIGSSDASEDQVRAMTTELGLDVRGCLQQLLPEQDVRVGVSNAARNMPTSQIASDYQSRYAGRQDVFWTDIHHYYNWGGCQGPDYQCICDAALPGTGSTQQDGDWANYVNAGVFEQGWRFYVGEWASAVGENRDDDRTRPAHMWQAQKFNYLSHYKHWMGKAAQGESSFIGDYYWGARFGFNWDPSPDVCAGETSTTDYKDFPFWDWNLLRLVKMGLAKPLSELGWTPSNLNPQGTCYDVGALDSEVVV